MLKFDRVNPLAPEPATALAFVKKVRSMAASNKGDPHMNEKVYRLLLARDALDAVVLVAVSAPAREPGRTMDAPSSYDCVSSSHEPAKPAITGLDRVAGFDHRCGRWALTAFFPGTCRTD